MKNIFCKICLASAFVFASVGILASETEELSGGAPDFTLPSNLGKNLRLGEMQGQVVMINFWASWCGPCQQEMPFLEQLHQRYSKAGFTLLGVSIDEDKALADKALKKLSTDVNFAILYDEASSVAEKYDLATMPSSVFVDKSGNMRYLHSGYKPGDEDSYKKIIKELIRE